MSNFFFKQDVIGNIAFGLELNSINDPDAEFRRMGKEIFSSSGNIQIKIVLAASFKKLARKLHVRILPSNVSDFFMKSVKDTVDYRLKNQIERNDVMDLLIKMKDNGTKEEGKISINELAAQCKYKWCGRGSLATRVLYTKHLKVCLILNYLPHRFHLVRGRLIDL
jgi:cytochrome P450 family 6